jgi:hypothetical protein
MELLYTAWKYIKCGRNKDSLEEKNGMGIFPCRA